MAIQLQPEEKNIWYIVQAIRSIVDELNNGGGGGGTGVTSLGGRAGDITLASGALSSNVLKIKENDLALADNTLSNSTTFQHGFLRRLSGNSGQYMDGSGNWSVPPSSGGGGGIPGGQVDGFLLETDGTTPFWAGFLQIGAGAVIRRWIDKVRDVVSLKDFDSSGGSNVSSAISNALASNGHAHVPPGSYTASSNVTLGNGQALIFDSNASISGPIDYTDGGSLSFNHNPSNITWTSANGTHRSMIKGDIGGYGNGSFGTQGLMFPVLGTVSIPSKANLPNHAAGVAGLAKTNSTQLSAVGLYGQAEINTTNAISFGLNTVCFDNGYKAAQIWGAEIDLNISNSNTNVVGIDMTGGSTVQMGLAICYRVGHIGVFTSPKKKWTHGLGSADGAAQIGVDLGATEDGGTSLGSQPVVFNGFDSSGNRRSSKISMGPGGSLNLDGSAGVSLRTDGGATSPVICIGNQISFFQSGRLGGLQNVTGSKSGVPALDSLLINLHNMGLINNQST